MGAVQAVVLVLAVLLIWHLRSLVMLLFAAVVASVGMDMVVGQMSRSCPHIPRRCAVFIVVAGLLLGVWLLTIFLLPEIIFQSKELAALGPYVFNATRRECLSKLTQLEEQLERMDFHTEQFRDLRSGITNAMKDPDLYSSLLAHVSGLWIIQGIGAHVGNLVRIVLVLLLATLLCISPEEHCQVLVNSAPAFCRRRVLEILGMCREALGSLLLGMAITSSGVGFLTWMGLFLLRCPLALSSGLLSGFLNFIPTVGPPIGILFPAVVALVTSRLLAWRALLLGICVQYVVKPILKPQVMRRYATILPTTALLAQAGFGLLLGFPGALLALPFVAVWQVVLREAWQRDLMDRWGTLEDGQLPRRRRPRRPLRLRLPRARRGSGGGGGRHAGPGAGLPGEQP